MAAKPISSSVVKRQRQALVQNVRKFIDSLLTHLDDCVEAKKNCSGCGGRDFHIQTSIEYAEDILAALKALR